MKKTLALSALAVVAGLLPARATVVLNTISLTGGTATQSSDPFGFAASRAIDGVKTGVNPDFSHTNNGANEWWRVTTPSAISADGIRVYNRTDCCSDRLNGAVVRAFSDAAWSTNVFTSPAVSGSPRVLDLQFGSRLSVQSLEVALSNNFLSLAEVELFTLDNVTLPLGTNLTRAAILGMSVMQSSEYNGGQFPAGNGVDGNNGSFTHTDGALTNPSWQVNFGEMMQIQSVNLHNREGCCPERLRDITVSVLDGSGTTLWTSALLNPANALGSPTDIFLDIAALNGGNPLVGQSILVSRTSSSGITQDDGNVLALGEVTVIGGSVIPEPGAVSLAALGALALVRRRRK